MELIIVTSTYNTFSTFNLQDIDKDTDALEKFRLEVQSAKREFDEKEGEIKDLKKQLGNYLKDETALKKKISTKVNEIFFVMNNTYDEI